MDNNSETPTSWILDGYIDDNFSERANEIQGREFLRRGVTPVVGQRVEVNMLTQGIKASKIVHLSGQVISLLPPVFDPSDLVAELQQEFEDKKPLDLPPVTQLIYPRMYKDDETGSLLLSETMAVVTEQMMEEDMHRQLHRPLPPDMEFITIEDKKSIMDGTTPCKILCMPRKRFLKNLVFPLVDHMNELLRQVIKDNIFMIGGAHGQQVMCQGRLNFDHDMLRAVEAGPWRDGIPMDGRDIYQWTMIFDECAMFGWKLDMDSIVNLGRNVQPRCWPWTLDKELPYSRPCVCCGDRKPSRNFEGYMNFHSCLGPFGCMGEDHEHTFLADAA